MSERTDLTTTAPMVPEDVPAELVALAMAQITLPGPVDFAALAEDEIRRALAAVLPLYGAGVIANAGVEHYNRQVELARSLTTRVYGASLLLHIAAEATQKANAGIDTALNLKLAETLRERAKQEGAP